MNAVALRRLLAPRDDANRPDLQVLSVYRDHGVVPKASRSDNFNKTPEDVTRYLHVQQGNLVVNKMKAWSGSVGVSNFEGIVSGDYLVCSVSSDLRAAFLHYVLRSAPLIAEMRRRSVGIRPNQERLYWDDLANIEIQVPAADTQCRIADFLDDRVALIDRLIAARRDQLASVALLREEQMQRLHDGLVDEFGAIRLGYLISGLEQGWSPQAESAPAGAHEWGVVRSGCVNGGVFRSADNKRLPDELAPRVEYEVMPGDLLMSRASGSLDLIGSVAVVPADVRPRLLLCDKIYRIFPAKSYNSELLAHMLRTRSNRDRIRLGVSGAEGMANNLPSGVVRDLRIPLVPEKRQRACLREANGHVDSESAGRAGLLRSIDLLTEYKSSLITAAVTGKLDVTSAGSGVPG